MDEERWKVRDGMILVEICISAPMNFIIPSIWGNCEGTRPSDVAKYRISTYIVAHRLACTYCHAYTASDTDFVPEQVLYVRHQKAIYCLQVVRRVSIRKSVEREI